MGLLLPDVDQDMDQDNEEDTEEEEGERKVERGEKGERGISSGPAAMFTEFPEWGHQSSLRLMQQLPDMQRHLQRTAAAAAAVTAEPGVQSESISLSEQRVIELEEEVANLKKRLEMA